MWEVEPTLYWRVKKNGKWTWLRANVLARFPEEISVLPITPEVDESENESESV